MRDPSGLGHRTITGDRAGLSARRQAAAAYRFCRRQRIRLRMRPTKDRLLTRSTKNRLLSDASL